VSLSRYRRLASVTSAALLAMMLLGTGVTSAATPGWKFLAAASIPGTVAPGADAGFRFDIKNTGKSNIAQVYLLNDSTDTIDYLSTSRGTNVCVTSPSLKCSFGALNVGQTIHVLIAYTTPSTAGTYNTHFYLNGTGNTGSDGGTSHGDSLPLDLSTIVSGNPNFAGGFQVNGVAVQTDPTLTTSNKQSTKLTPPSTQLLGPVTVEDGIADFPGGFTNPCLTHACFGDWASLTARDSLDQLAGPIRVELNIKGIASNTDPLSIGLWHDGTIIMTRCSTSTLPTGTGECVTVTKIGNGANAIFQIVGWLNHNGTIRGLFG